ncbi:unnamed protein product, partial [Mesorhabditis belari]|uniref:EF-hand domain-containing protein n=1 Tax=Mesorhabditis belari TaxID=2138241 RepID=A0AAF3ELS0_9BILA
MFLKGVLFFLFISICLSIEVCETNNRLEKVIKRTFRGIDLNKDGSVDRDEYRNYLVKRFGEKMADQSVDEILKRADYDGDTKLAMDEYILYIESALGRGDIVDKLIHASAQLGLLGQQSSEPHR